MSFSSSMNWVGHGNVVDFTLDGQIRARMEVLLGVPPKSGIS